MESSIRFGKVTAIYNSGYSADVVLLTDGARYSAVQVLAAGASTNTGTIDLPKPTAPGSAYGAEETGDRDVYCVLGFEGQHAPVILGFFYPQICQMTFDDEGRRITRHASDVYTSVDGEGNIEVYHPSGTYLRIGTATAHEDLTGQDFDKKWAIARNTDKQVYVHLAVRNGGADKASLSIAPTGNITVNTIGDLNLSVAGAITSNANVWNHTGNYNVTGTITATVDVVGGGKSLKTHTHGGVTSGGGITGAPS